MRSTVLLSAGLTFFASALIGVVSCVDYQNDCTLNNQPCPTAGTGGAASSSTTMMSSSGTMSSTSSSSSSTGTGGQKNCDPQHGGVDAQCGGIFVTTTGDNSAAGDRDHPVKSIATALMLASAAGMPVYACDEDLSETSTINIPAGTTIFGGLDCKSDWSFKTGKQTVLNGVADQVSVMIPQGQGTTKISDVKITSASASVVGGSSIAMIVDGGTAVFTRVEIVAGDGKDGAPGTDGGAQLGQAPSGKPGDNALDPGKAGGAGGINMTCGLTGGDGGGGGPLNGVGMDGGMGDGNAQGGTAGAKENGQLCTAGGPGSSVSAGMHGLGAKGLGSIDPTGFHGLDGTKGDDGPGGHSGGGGGGSKGLAIHGAGGGGGGAGGCGGTHGEGGTHGGASIAVVSLNANVTITDSKLRAGNGGNGGKGGDGQVGQQGGQQALGGNGTGLVNPGCAGGAGSRGGDGGNGGGGQGGHSLAIAYTITAPMLMGSTLSMTTSGTKGLGGKGGTGDADANHGDDGIAGSQQPF